MTFTIDRKFPKLEAGNDDVGRIIRDQNGKRVGRIVREIDWRDVGSVSTSYRATITSYVFEDWERDQPDVSRTVPGRNFDGARVFKTLSEAMAVARVAFPGLRTD